MDAVHEISQALEERDAAIQAKLDGIDKKAAKLDERLFTIEQNAASMADGPWPHTKEHKPSLLKVINHRRNPEKPLGGIEGDYHAKMKEKLPTPSTTTWFDLGELKTKAVDYSAGSPTAGGSSLVDREQGALIEYLYNSANVLRLGATTVRATGDLDLPKQDGASAAYWVSGENEAITESDPSYTRIQMRPKYLTGLVTVYARMLTQTGGDIERMVGQDLMQVLAVELDRAAINGSGSGSEPTGILQTANILTDVWTGSPSTFQWGDAVEAERLLAANNSLRGSVAWLMGAAVMASAKTTTKVSSDAGAGFIMDGGRINGYQVAVSENCPASTAIFGNWRDLVIAEWGTVGIDINPYGATDFAAGSVKIRAMLPCDIAVRHPESFVKSSAT